MRKILCICFIWIFCSGLLKGETSKPALIGIIVAAQATMAAGQFAMTLPGMVVNGVIGPALAGLWVFNQVNPKEGETREERQERRENEMRAELRKEGMLTDKERRTRDTAANQGFLEKVIETGRKNVNQMNQEIKKKKEG